MYSLRLEYSIDISPPAPLNILPHVTACSVTLDLFVFLYLSDAGSLWECRQLTVEQLSINRSSTGQVRARCMTLVSAGLCLCLQTSTYLGDMKVPSEVLKASTAL